MQVRSRQISSPLRGYVARLFKRDQRQCKYPQGAVLSNSGSLGVLPGLEPLERRLLLSASFGPEPPQAADALQDRNLPTVDITEAPARSLEIANIKWRGQQVDAVQYEWIVRYDVDAQLSDAALAALVQDLSPFVEIQNLSAPGFGVLTAPLPKLKGWQLNRWARTQDAIAYLEPNFIGESASITPNDPAYYDRGMWGLRNQGDQQDGQGNQIGQISLGYDPNTSTFVENACEKPKSVFATTFGRLHSGKIVTVYHTILVLWEAKISFSHAF